MRPVLLLSITLAAATVTAPSQAVEPSGTAVAVVQSTDVEAATGRRLLQVSAPIFSGDRVKTGASGEAQLRFRDQTKLVVGPNSSVLIDKFIFDDTGTGKAIALNAVRGTFRFITGSSPKSAYTIRTSTATIGVRGTRFDLSVIGGVTRFALLEGGARVCDRRGRCVELRGRCEVAEIPAGSGIRKIPGGSSRLALVQASFPYIRSQARLLPEFRADTSGCSVSHADNAKSNNSTLASSSDGGGDTGGGDTGGGDTGGGDTGGGDTGSSGNHSGLGDGSNPGLGSGNNSSGNTGTGNPGGSK